MTGVLLALSMLVRAPSGSADGGTGAQASVIQVQYANPGLIPGQWTMVIHPDGSGHFSSQRGDAPREQPGGVEATHIDRDIELTPQFAARIFQLAHRKKLFRMQCESRLKVAFRGLKTLTYTGPDGHGACSFNYSNDEDIEALGDSLVSVATTLIEGERLELLLRHDPLGLDRETQTLMEMAGDGRAQQVNLIRPILERLAEDDTVLERVRKRACSLLAQAGD